MTPVAQRARGAEWLRAAVLALLPLGIVASGCSCGRGAPRASTPDDGARAPVAPAVQSAPLARPKETPVPPAPERTLVVPRALASARDADARYVAPDALARRAFADVVRLLLEGGHDDEASARARALGFVVEALSAEGDSVLLREASIHGGGAYVFRRASASKLVVEAPHTFHDENTLPIAWTVFERAQARALFVNTVHRYRGAPAENGRWPADLAHAEDSLFQTATEAAAAAIAPLDVVQIHGFGSREGSAAFAVVSGGERRVAPHAARAREALAAAFGAGVALFPTETSELGATTNVQGPVVRRAAGRFLHVELAADARRDLVANASRRLAFADAVVRAFEVRP